MAVFGSNLFLPLAVVTEKIPESACLFLKGKPQECKISAGQRRVWMEVGPRRTVQQSCNNERTCVVIGRIPLKTVGHRKDGVLQDACVVSHAGQMGGIQRR